MAVTAEFVTPASPVFAAQAGKKKNAAILLSRFPQAEVKWYKLPPTRIGGVVTWEGFEGFTFRERRRMVWDALEKHLTPEEMDQTIVLYTATPFENTFTEQPDPEAYED